MKMRYEIKFCVKNSDLSSVIETINSNFFSIKQLYPDRKIHSIYYDDIDFNCYFNHINGVSNRHKTRVRWYNNDLSKLTFEKKVKLGNKNFKEQINLKSNFFSEPLYKHYEMFNFLATPTLLTNYQRSYFYVKDFEKIRITFDTLLNSTHPTTNLNYSSKNLIIELKAQVNQKNNLNELIKRIPIRYTKYSKYVSGIRAIYY